MRLISSTSLTIAAPARSVASTPTVVHTKIDDGGIERSALIGQVFTWRTVATRALACHVFDVVCAKVGNVRDERSAVSGCIAAAGGVTHPLLYHVT